MFEQADALRTLGVKAPSKLSIFVETVDTSNMQIGDAVALSKIMIDSIAAATALEREGPFPAATGSREGAGRAS